MRCNNYNTSQACSGPSRIKRAVPYGNFVVHLEKNNKYSLVASTDRGTIQSHRAHPDPFISLSVPLPYRKNNSVCVCVCVVWWWWWGGVYPTQFDLVGSLAFTPVCSSHFTVKEDGARHTCCIIGSVVHSCSVHPEYPFEIVVNLIFPSFSLRRYLSFRLSKELVFGCSAGKDINLS